LGEVYSFMATRSYSWGRVAALVTLSLAPALAQDAEHLDVLRFLRRPHVTPVPAGRGIDEKMFVPVGGIEQWITIRGFDKANPVLLLLHGGPGDATNPWAWGVLDGWTRPFVLVQWDQRGTGRTLGKSGPGIASTITIDRMVEDGIELSEFLRTHLGKRKIIVVGHSWGSVLGTLMVKKRQDLFWAYVGTGQVVSGKRSYAVAYEELLKRARREHNEEAMRELESIGPPPYDNAAAKQQVQRKWANEFEGAGMFLARAAGLGVIAEGYTLADVNDWLQGQLVTGRALFQPVGAVDLASDRTGFGLPVFLLQGADDYTTPAPLVREYFRGIKAPQKELVELKGGHFVAFMQPEIFLEELTRRVRPLAQD
jgi:pimeloyl-ACP methyl ester carboxylesterase